MNKLSIKTIETFFCISGLVCGIAADQPPRKMTPMPPHESKIPTHESKIPKDRFIGTSAETSPVTGDRAGSYLDGEDAQSVLSDASEVSDSSVILHEPENAGKKEVDRRAYLVSPTPEEALIIQKFAAKQIQARMAALAQSQEEKPSFFDPHRPYLWITIGAATILLLGSSYAYKKYKDKEFLFEAEILKELGLPEKAYQSLLSERGSYLQRYLPIWLKYMLSMNDILKEAETLAYLIKLHKESLIEKKKAKRQQQAQQKPDQK